MKHYLVVRKTWIWAIVRINFQFDAFVCFKHTIFILMKTAKLFETALNMDPFPWYRITLSLWVILCQPQNESVCSHSLDVNRLQSYTFCYLSFMLYSWIIDGLTIQTMHKILYIRAIQLNLIQPLDIGLIVDTFCGDVQYSTNTCSSNDCPMAIWRLIQINRKLLVNYH